MSTARARLERPRVDLERRSGEARERRPRRGVLPRGPGRGGAVRFFAAAVPAAVTAVLAYGSFKVVMADRQQGQMLPIGLPVWVSECVMPLAFALMALRFVLRASPRLRGRLLAVAAVLSVFSLGQAGG